MCFVSVGDLSCDSVSLCASIEIVLYRIFCPRLVKCSAYVCTAMLHRFTVVLLCVCVCVR